MTGFMIAAAHKSSGKTVVTTGLTAALRSRGHAVQCFKKGPDYIDPMWLTVGSGRTCYNLDFNTMDDDSLRHLYAAKSKNADISIIEANKGLYDGVDVAGLDANAQLAKLLDTPVILVIDTVGMTRGIAPLLLGYQLFDPKVNIAGVILNKVGGTRHEGKLRRAVEAFTDIPVIGAVWRNAALNIGERHLGLTTPAETGKLETMVEAFAEIIRSSVNLDQVEKFAKQAPEQLSAVGSTASPHMDLRIGIARDAAFGFYYADDLEAFAEAGAELIDVDMMVDPHLPEIDGLFIGGGFPEMQMKALSANASLRQDIRTAIENGLPAYAECGGLMYLSNSLQWHGETLPMVGVIDGDTVMYTRPQGRGYTIYEPTAAARWGGSTTVPAHEFHYARIENLPADTMFARTMKRGYGTDGEHDGVMVNNLTAGFVHLRNTKTNPWVGNFVQFVRQCKQSKRQK